MGLCDAAGASVLRPEDEGVEGLVHEDAPQPDEGRVGSLEDLCGTSEELAAQVGERRGRASLRVRPRRGIPFL